MPTQEELIPCDWCGTKGYWGTAGWYHKSLEGGRWFCSRECREHWKGANFSNYSGKG